jgi:ATP-dependent DNA ligase
VVDGELIGLDQHGRVTFEGLQSLLNPDKSAPRSIVKFVAFDLLALGNADLRSKEFWQRRQLLERELDGQQQIDTTPQTSQSEDARRWLENFQDRGIEGVVAKERNLPYLSGRRLMVKVRARHSLDCVVGGFVPGRDGKPIVLLLGLYAEDGVLDHVGQSSVLSAPVAREAWRRLQPYLGGESFADGRLPGYSRWQEQRPSEWISVEPVIVCEVAYTAVDNFRLRHGASFLRWRDDRDPGDCWLSQLAATN